MVIQKVTLLGADGTLGPSVPSALLKRNFTVTVLKRSSSNSPDGYPSSVKVARVPDDFSLDVLTTTLSGQDALVATIKGTQVDLQKKLADACVAAHVQRFIPADFGSCDSSTQLTQDLVPLYKNKTELRRYLQDLAERHSSFTWTALVCGHFFDWSLPFIHLWPRERRADVLDDGEYKCSLSTLYQVGEATAAVLQRAEDTGKQTLFVQSFCVTQNEVVRAFEAATQGEWQVSRLKADAFREEWEKKRDGGNTDAVEQLVWYLGTVDAEWPKREGFAMERLGLRDEDLLEVARRVVKEIGR